jgi:hypothetical protein
MDDEYSPLLPQFAHQDDDSSSSEESNDDHNILDQVFTERKRRREEWDSTLYLMVVAVVEVCTREKSSFVGSKQGGSPHSSRQSSPLSVFIKDDDGNMVCMTPMLSPWYHTYIVSPLAEDNWWANKF